MKAPILRQCGRLALVLAVAGFFMPVSCNENGFELVRAFGESGDLSLITTALALCVSFAAALAGAAIGILLLAKKRVPEALDRITLVLSVAFGLYAYFAAIRKTDSLQAGGYLIAAGWMLSLAFQLAAALRSLRRH